MDTEWKCNLILLLCKTKKKLQKKKTPCFACAMSTAFKTNLCRVGFNASHMDFCSFVLLYSAQSLIFFNQ